MKKGMANNFYNCGFIIFKIKIVEFKVDKKVLWNTQNAQDCIIFI